MSGLTFGGFFLSKWNDELKGEGYCYGGSSERTFDQNVNSRYTSPQYLSLFVSANHSKHNKSKNKQARSVHFNPATHPA